MNIRAAGIRTFSLGAFEPKAGERMCLPSRLVTLQDGVAIRYIETHSATGDSAVKSWFICRYIERCEWRNGGL